VFHLAGFEGFVKGYGSVAREVDELVKGYEVASADLLAKASASRRSKDVGTADLIDGPDIGPVVYLRGRDGMLAPMSGEQDHLAPVDKAAFKIGSSWPVRGFNFQIGCIFHDRRIFKA
jgi:hypothetical protein